jgi:hypothetical protein
MPHCLLNAGIVQKRVPEFKALEPSWRSITASSAITGDDKTSKAGVKRASIAFIRCDFFM